MYPSIRLFHSANAVSDGKSDDDSQKRSFENCVKKKERKEENEILCKELFFRSCLLVPKLLR